MDLYEVSVNGKTKLVEFGEFVENKNGPISEVCVSSPIPDNFWDFWSQMGKPKIRFWVGTTNVSVNAELVPKEAFIRFDCPVSVELLNKLNHVSELSCPKFLASSLCGYSGIAVFDEIVFDKIVKLDAKYKKCGVILTGDVEKQIAINCKHKKLQVYNHSDPKNVSEMLSCFYNIKGLKIRQSQYETVHADIPDYVIIGGLDIIQDKNVFDDEFVKNRNIAVFRLIRYRFV